MNKDHILVSVIILAFNYAKYIEQAIQTFLSQKVASGIELLISEDCSSDSTLYQFFSSQFVLQSNRYSNATTLLNLATTK